MRETSVEMWLTSFPFAKTPSQYALPVQDVEADALMTVRALPLSTIDLR